jgi:hypothetical protein
MRQRLSLWGKSPERRPDAGVTSQETIMAKAANASSVADSRRGPNYKAALSILRIEIPAQKTRVGKINGQIGEYYGKIEGSHKVNKAGAQIFMKLDAIEDDAERADVFRSLMGLIMVSGWPVLGGDLVDQAQNAEVDPRVWWNRDHPDAIIETGTPDEGEDEEAEDSEKGKVVKDDADKPKPEPEVKAKRVSAAEAKAAAARHLKVVPTTVRTTEKLPPADPDADLAGE